MKTLLAIALIVFSAALVRADLPADFLAANQLYAQGKFAAAADAYDKMLGTGLQSPALLFNDANAQFKAGHLGEAIAAYRRAELLAPRDAEIRANLQFVRNQVPGGTVHEHRWQGWLGTLSLGEWTGITVLAFWFTLGLLIAAQVRPALAPRLKTATWASLLLAVGFGSLLAVQAAGHFSRATAIVTPSTTTARSGPFDDAQATFTTHDGAELTVLDRHDNWVQVADPAGHTGWLPLKWVEILPGA